MEKNIIHYKPYTNRTEDPQYQILLQRIINEGKKKTSFHAHAKENENSGHKHCIEIPGYMLQYNLSNGVPIMPTRDLGNSYKGAIGEIVAFINGARTLEELVAYGCPKVFWERWVTKEKCAVWKLLEGDLGPGSYGAILTEIPIPRKWWEFWKKRTFNQIEALERQMRKNPFARTNLISTWYTPLAMGDKKQKSPRGVVVAPCHGNMIQFDVMDDRSMNMTIYQRSADAPVGLVLNLTEWIAFGMMVAYIADLKFEWYTHFLPNSQIYDIQIEQIEELISRTPKKLPSLFLRPKRIINSLKDFRKEDFELEDYHPYEKMMIRSVV